MTRSPQSHGASLRRLHRVALGMLALGAVYLFMNDEAGSENAPPQIYTLVALGFAVGSIVARRFSTSPVLQPGMRFFWATLALVLALGIAATAILLVALESERQNALLFLLGAALLCLRPPAAIGPRPAARTSPSKEP